MARINITLNLEEELVAKARAISKKHNMSVSELINQYLTRLTSDVEASSSLVERLRGILPGNADIDDYYLHLDKKYGL